MLSVSGIFNLVSNYKGGDCLDPKIYKLGDKSNCKLSWDMQFTIANKKNQSKNFKI